MSRARKGMETNSDPNRELAAELRQSAGREWMEEAAEDERLTDLLRRRRLELSEVIRDLAHRGERVSVEFGGHSFSGAVMASGVDYASVEGAGQAADIRLDTARWSVLVPGPSVEPWLDAPETFRGVLQQHGAGETVVRLALPGGDLVIGTIAVVAVDHLEFDDVDQRKLYVPIEMVLGVIRSADFH